MSAKAKKNNIIFRPHFKTHQSAQIGEWFREYGTSKITVSSIEMAVYFSDHGWNDILIAFPVNLLEITAINSLAKKIRLQLLVDSHESVQFLKKHLSYEVGIYIKIDTGYHRSGLDAENKEEVLKLAKEISEATRLNFIGLLTHSGHTYDAKSKKQIQDIFNDTDEKLIALKLMLQSNGRNPIISIGDTPSCSIVPDFKNADEIRPGNFVFYDLMQLYLGVCSADDIAVRMACPVVSKNKTRKEIIIYGGATHLSKEFAIDSNGQKHYGLVTKGGFGNPIQDCFVSSLSQEHGVVKLSEEYFNELNIGDLIEIIPVHSCLTANLNKSLYSIAK